MSARDTEGALVPHDLATELIQIIRSSSSPISVVPPSVASDGGPRVPLRSVLFDVYGTLFTSASGDVFAPGTLEPVAHIGNAETENDSDPRESPFVSALSAAGCTVLEPEACAAVAETEYLAGITSRHREKRRAGIRYPEVDILEIWREVLAELSGSALIAIPDDPATLYRVAVAYEVRSNPVWPMPGAIEILRRLASEDVVLGIVSNAQFYTPLLFPAFFERTLTELQFDPRLCIFSFQVGVAKPSARLFTDVAERLVRLHGLSSEQVLYIGNDMRNDVWAAGQAGFQTALFAGDSRSLRLRSDDPECRGVHPSWTVRNLDELATAWN